MYRTYVHIPQDEEFTHQSWCKHLAAGRSYLSSGPMLDFTVEGVRVGETVKLPAGGGTVEVEVRAESIFPMHTLEIVQQGKVVASTQEPKGARRLRLQARVRVDGHSWLAARVGGPGYSEFLSHWDLTGRRGIFAHTSPIYVACGGDWEMLDRDAAQYMLNMYEGAQIYLRNTALHYRPGTVTHHHGEDDHLAYLERPFRQARDAVLRKLERWAQK